MNPLHRHKGMSIGYQVKHIWKISFLSSLSEKWVWESSPKIDPATGVRRACTKNLSIFALVVREVTVRQYRQKSAMKYICFRYSELACLFFNFLRSTTYDLIRPDLSVGRVQAENLFMIYHFTVKKSRQWRNFSHNTHWEHATECSCRLGVESNNMRFDSSGFQRRKSPSGKSVQDLSLECKKVTIMAKFFAQHSLRACEGVRRLVEVSWFLGLVPYYLLV